MGEVKGLEGRLRPVRDGHPSLRMIASINENGNVVVETSGYRIGDYQPYVLDLGYFLAEETEERWTYTKARLSMGGSFRDQEGMGIDIWFSMYGNQDYGWCVSPSRDKPVPSEQFTPLMGRYITHLENKEPFHWFGIPKLLQLLRHYGQKTKS